MEDRDIIMGDDGKDFITYAREAIGQIPLDIKVKKLNEKAVIPFYAHDGDVGMDLTAIDLEYDREHDMYIYHTGLSFETDKHYGILLFPRSSNRKTDCYLCNHVGIADTAIYRGEIMLCYKNRTSLAVRAEMERCRNFFSQACNSPFTVTSGNGVSFTWQDYAKYAQSSYNWVFERPLDFAPYNVGDRVGQMVVIPYPNVRINEVGELSSTERGDGGFGSTGN